MNKRMIALLMLAFLAAQACDIVNSFKHDDVVVAKVGRNRLYLSDLERYIPDGSSPGDSARIARNFIDSWAVEHVFVKSAEKYLSKEELNVESELEDYRKSLLRYRYEQRYINANLDTAITASQIREWYDAHQESFNLVRPILKVRFVDIMKGSPNEAEILDKLSADEPQLIHDLDSLAYSSALSFKDLSDRWTDAAELAKDFGTDWRTLIGQIKGKVVKIESEGDVKAAYVFDMQKDGVAPIEFCAETIRDNILSERKRALLVNLEQDLLTSARENKDFTIISKE